MEIKKGRGNRKMQEGGGGANQKNSEWFGYFMEPHIQENCKIFKKDIKAYIPYLYNINACFHTYLQFYKTIGKYCANPCLLPL